MEVGGVGWGCGGRRRGQCRWRGWGSVRGSMCVIVGGCGVGRSGGFLRVRAGSWSDMRGGG